MVPGKGLQRKDDARLEFGGHGCSVEFEILHVALGKLGGQQTDGGKLFAGKIEIEAGVLHDDFGDANFQGVARFGAVHVDRAGNGMGAAAVIGETKLDDFVDGDSWLDLVHAVAPGFDGYGVAGIDDELGFFRGIVPAPLHGVFVRGEHIVLAGGFLCGRFFPKHFGLAHRCRAR